MNKLIHKKNMADRMFEESPVPSQTDENENYSPVAYNPSKKLQNVAGSSVDDSFSTPVAVDKRNVLQDATNKNVIEDSIVEDTDDEDDVEEKVEETGSEPESEDEEISESLLESDDERANSRQKQVIRQKTVVRQKKVVVESSESEGSGEESDKDDAGSVVSESEKEMDESIEEIEQPIKPPQPPKKKSLLLTKSKNRSIEVVDDDDDESDDGDESESIATESEGEVEEGSEEEEGSWSESESLVEEIVETDGEEEVVKSKPKSKTTKVVLVESSEEEESGSEGGDESEEDEVEVVKPKIRTKRIVSSEEEAEESEDDEIVVSKKVIGTKKVELVESSEQEEVSGSEEEEEAIVLAGQHGRTKLQAMREERRPEDESESDEADEVVSDSGSEVESDEDEEIGTKKMAMRRPEDNSGSEIEEESDGENELESATHVKHTTHDDMDTLDNEANSPANDSDIVLDSSPATEAKSFSKYRDKDNSNEVEAILSSDNDESFHSSAKGSNPSYSPVTTPKKQTIQEPFTTDRQQNPKIDLNSSPEIIEISDTESPLKTKQQAISHFLADIKPNIKDEAMPNVKNEVVERKMKTLDLEDHEVQKKVAALDRPKLTVQAQRGATQKATMKNYNYEESLKVLGEAMLDVIEDKPCPEMDFKDLKAPSGIKVELLSHQKYSMCWLKWREDTYPHGSILADDMGLGKTLTVLAYLKMVKDRMEEKEEAKLGPKKEEKPESEDEITNDTFSSSSYLKRIKKKVPKRDERCVKRLKTLIVLPASLLHQWQGEIKSKFARDSFKVHVYHEADRKKRCHNMEDNDLVFTTYEIVSREISLVDKAGNECTSDSPLARIKWRRIILDEAHRIKNHSTKASKAICSLRAKYRIAVTGTPIHNSLNDLYSLVKFLHFEPLNDFGLWKYLFTSEKFVKEQVPSANSIERSKRLDNWTTFLSDFLMLRRTKQDKFKGTNKRIVDLPERTFEVIKFGLGTKEKVIYEQIFDESKTKVNEFLKNQKNRLMGKVSANGTSSSYSDIFVYLLRLRQACCHMSLLAECLDKDELKSQKFESDGIEGAMENLAIKGETSNGDSIGDETLQSMENIQKDDDLSTCLEPSFKSSKLQTLIEMVQKSLDDFPNDKLIIVSQWTGVLNIIANLLQKRHITYCEIKGSVKLFERNEIVNDFNEVNNTELRVMLLSLTAGGVGLNLIGANRMFLLDIHWNPALEQQCGDRIYRVGQKKPVTIYKFLCENTIEERIETIQNGKIELANKVYGDVGTGTGATNTKLTASDFKLMFTDFAPKPPQGE